MPNRQIVVYDKRLEVIQKQKKEWWDFWRLSADRNGIGAIDLERAQIWRIEARLGGDAIVARFKSRLIGDVLPQAGAALHTLLSDVRLTTPTPDRNRSRWPTHPAWELAQRSARSIAIADAGLGEPLGLRERMRRELEEAMDRQRLGVLLTQGALAGVDGDSFAAFIARTARKDEALVSTRRADVERDLADRRESYAIKFG